VSEQRGYPTSTHYRARYSSQHKPSSPKCVAFFMMSALELEKIFVWRSVRSAAPDFNGGKRINCIMDLMSMPRGRARSDTMVIFAGRAKRSSLGLILRKMEQLTYKVGIALRSIRRAVSLSPIFRCCELVKSFRRPSLTESKDTSE